MHFRKRLSQMWNNLQATLFPQLKKSLGELSEEYKTLVSVLELTRIEEFLTCTKFNGGRPIKDRPLIARAFVAKFVLNIKYTKQLVKQLNVDDQLKSICGWSVTDDIPHESTFSRAFKEFAQSSLPDAVHENLVKNVYRGTIVGHLVKDSTPLEVREKAIKKMSPADRKKEKSKRRTRRRHGELNRRQKQLQEQCVDKMIEDLPKHCDKGMKKSSHGYTQIWKGYKIHAAVDDHCVPISVIVTSASVQDCEAAIPLATKAHKLVTNFYDLMDAAYDHPEIKEHSALLGHVPVIDKCPANKEQKNEKIQEKERKKELGFWIAEDRRYKERLPKERFNALYKDYHGGRSIYYRGYTKVCCHVMFGTLSMAAKIILKFLE